jgi:L-fuculose-phosphate aldolase
MNLEETKQQVCRWMEKLAEEGVIQGTGCVISCRFSDVMIITPENAYPGKCRPDDLVAVSLEDMSWGGKNSPAPEYILHAAVYRKKKKMNALIHTTQLNILTASKAGHEVRPMLDDMAQIVGASAKIASFGTPPAKKDAGSVLRGLRRRSAVLLAGNGALCAGSTFDEAHAVAQVLEKGCKCFIESTFLGGGVVINRIERNLMRLVYVLKYSRAAETNK